MTVLDWGLLALMALAVGLALRKIRRDKQAGKGCCGNCSGCTAACTSRSQTTKK